MTIQEMNGKVRFQVIDWMFEMPKELHQDIQRDIVVAGGCFASMIHGEEPNDYDCYFRTSATAERVWSAQQAKSIHTSQKAMLTEKNIHLVKSVYGTPREIVDGFDFSHTRAYWTFDDGVVMLPEAIVYASEKKLHYQGGTSPLSSPLHSLIRIQRFSSRGWTVNQGQTLKILARIVGDVDWTDEEDVAHMLRLAGYGEAMNDMAGILHAYVNKTATVTELDEFIDNYYMGLAEKSPDVGTEEEESLVVDPMDMPF